MHTTAYWINLPDGTGTPEAEAEKAQTLSGLVNLVRTIAPLYLMCDRGDIIVHGHERDPHFRRPTLFVADNVPGGVGLAEALFDLGSDLFHACRDALSNCKCAWGCPACIGASVSETGEKQAVKLLLEEILRMPLQ